MRRLYSTFAGGWPGTGLLLMRSVLGLTLLTRACMRLWAHPSAEIAILSVLLILTGILLTLGLWTPIAGSSAALIEIWKLMMLSGDRWIWFLLGVMGAALAMLGPGQWSIDARLYGWKRLDSVPRKQKR